MNVTQPAAVIVLAAGEGTRMKSAAPKVLHELCGRPMVDHVLTAVTRLNADQVVVVVGHGRQQVAEHLTRSFPHVRQVVQEEQNGTGHAVRTVLETTRPIAGTVLVTYADTPVLRAQTLTTLLQAHAEDRNAVTVLTAEPPDPSGYGRIVRDPTGTVLAIVEQADAASDDLAITEINSGVYAFDGARLADAVKRVATTNAKGEEYLTDVLGILRADGHRIGTILVDDWTEIVGVNDRVQLAEARRALNDRILIAHMRAGVTIVDPASTWIETDVRIEPDVLVHPGTQLRGGTRIERGAEVGPCCTLTDSIVSQDATVTYSVCEGAEIGPQASVGPYSYLRPGTRLAAGTKVGPFVETKNAVVGEGSKVPHLSYVGDAEIGKESNIGASSVFVNYDGVRKHRTVVGDHVRIGSDNMLVAPVTVGDGAYTGAGTVVRRNVPPGALAVSAGAQRNVEGWVEENRPGTPAAEAARRARESGRQGRDVAGQ